VLSTRSLMFMSVAFSSWLMDGRLGRPVAALVSGGASDRSRGDQRSGSATRSG
jgi:hypothetical protein